MRMLHFKSENYLRLNINLFSVYVKPNITLLAGSMATCSKSEKIQNNKTSKQLFLKTDTKYQEEYLIKSLKLLFHFSKS